MTVLVVEDDDKVLTLYQTLFLQWEWDFVLARSVDKALSVLTGEDRIDLVILDLKFDGFEQGRQFMEAMQERDDIRDLPVVLVTARPEAVLTGSWAGLIKAQTPVAIVPKPFSQEALLEGINTVREAAQKMRKKNGNGKEIAHA